MSVLLACCLSLSGCTYQQVNEVSLFKYRRSDDASRVALKTAGNLVPWTFQAAVAGAWYTTVGAFYVGVAYLEARAQER
jgi:hypothetical protein